MAHGKDVHYPGMDNQDEEAEHDLYNRLTPLDENYYWEWELKKRNGDYLPGLPQLSDWYLDPVSHDEKLGLKKKLTTPH